MRFGTNTFGLGRRAAYQLLLDSAADTIRISSRYSTTFLERSHRNPLWACQRRRGAAMRSAPRGASRLEICTLDRALTNSHVAQCMRCACNDAEGPARRRVDSGEPGPWERTGDAAGISKRKNGATMSEQGVCHSRIVPCIDVKTLGKER